MRPLPGDDSGSGRLRQRPNPQMSFFLADEASLDAHLDNRPTQHPPRHTDHRKKSSTRDLSPHSPQSRTSACSYSLASLPSPSSHIDPSISSRPITPLMLGPSCAVSAASTPSSRRNSVASSLSEIAISLSDEHLDDPATELLESGSAPQLIMPSINMPSRRPFTETGKSLGRLKILVAGPAGVGKTSLLKAIVQSCHHIVHVDPLSGASSRRNSLSDTLTSLSRQTITPTANIAEIQASTKPYPEWWSDLETPRAPHRRKSLSRSVLERNICFVDTPGYGMDTSVMETVMPCVDYVESYLSKVTADELDDSDMMNMLGGGGGSQVDVVLYLISGGLKPADMEYMRQLAPLTNVIPILARADLLPAEQILASKREIVMQLQTAGITPFSFTPSDREEQSSMIIPGVPYTASSISIADHDEMDASLLMNSEYVQPLLRTDLAFLVEKIFSVDGASWLRHSAAKKYLQWREATPSRPRHLYRPLVPPREMALLPIRPSSRALARVRRHELEPREARLHLADWAADLQRSVMDERAWYETLSRGEQAVWLTEKVAECVKDGTLVARSPPKEQDSRTATKRGKRKGGKTQHHQDPLGLLQVAADIKASGWVALEMAGGLGLIGTAVYIMGRNWQDIAVCNSVWDLVF